MNVLMKQAKRAVMRATGAFLASHGRVTAPDGEWFYVSPTTHGIDCLALRTGRYEVAETTILKQHFQPDDTIIEIGSNIGYVARYAIREKLLPGGRYICVEPNPAVQQTLVSNMLVSRLYCPGSEFRIVQAALDAPSEKPLSALFRQRSNLSSGLVAFTAPKRKDIITEVPATSLSAVLKQHAPKGASLICDAEGGEIPMILKDRDALANIRQAAVEFHEPGLTGRPETPDGMISQMESIGFVAKARLKNTVYFSRAPQ